MRFTVIKASGADLASETLVVSAWADGITELPVVDRLCNGLLGRLWDRGSLSGKAEEAQIVYTDGPCQQVVILGLGKKEQFNAEKARRCGAALSQTLATLKSSRVKIMGDFSHALGALVEGLILGGYKFSKYKTKEPKEQEAISCEILSDDKDAAQMVYEAQVLAESVNLARDLVNEPGNELPPAELAKRAQEVANSYGLGYRRLGPMEIEKLGMGGLIGVSKGSAQSPEFIILSYKGNKESEKSIGFVGKGLTFDAGGISLKPVKGMGDMKSDMAGGAAVIAAMGAIARLKPHINITAIIPVAENLPSGSALKPGDIIKIMDGTTVEIISTDAEGRLILADGIAYAKGLGLEPIIDVATLTGACSIALGPVYSGLWTNNENLQQTILEAAGLSGEKLWPMPYDEEFYERTKSPVADLKNSGGGEGGACAAASFLGHFAGATNWAHLDIAPTGFSDTSKGYIKKGGTGVAVRTLTRLALLMET